MKNVHLTEYFYHHRVTDVTQTDSQSKTRHEFRVADRLLILFQGIILPSLN